MYVVDVVNVMRAGTLDQRVRAVATLLMWFAAGAFILSTIDVYVPLARLSDFWVSTIGGTLAAVLSIFIKLR